jgi:hypothetical protein
MRRTDQPHQAVTRDASVAGVLSEFACRDRFELWAAWSRFPDPHHEIGGFWGMGLNQLEAENPSVVDMNRPGSDRVQGGFCLAFPVFGDDDQFREPGLDIDVKVEPGPGLTAPAANRPSDGGGGFEEGAIDGEDLPVQRGERLGGLSLPRLEDFASELIEDWLQPGGVGQLVEVGEGTFAEFRDREMFLGLSGLAEILKGSQGPQRGIEEGEEVGDKDIVEEKVAISVGTLFPELVDKPFEGMNVLGPEDLLGPDGQVALGQVRRARAFGSLRRSSQARGSLLGRHNRIIGGGDPMAQMKI